MNKKDIKEIIKKCLNWLRKNQLRTGDFHDGGFSPYPETVKAAGTLATADVLTFLQRSKLERPDLGELTKRAANFLIRVQLPNGGFPPMGDFELITNTPFTDSTADAVLGLLSVYKQIRDKEVQKKISYSIEKGIEWLLQTYTACGLPLPTYITNHNYGPRRYFPTLLTGIAFITYTDYCDRINRDIKKEVNEYINALKTLVLDKLSNDGYITINDSQNELSFMNTILSIEFIHTLNSSINKDDRNIQTVLRKGYNTLLSQYKNLLLSNKNDVFTEFDPVHINIAEISEGDYPATYFTLPSMIRLLVEYPLSDNPEEYQSLVDELISKLLDLVEIVNDFAYFWEYRGRKEPATSATASAIYTLKKYVEVLK